MTKESEKHPKESVWDYPRPPRVEECPWRIRVTFNGEVIADTRRAYRVLETSHPPVYYIPLEDIRMEYLYPSKRRSVCEFKGIAYYWNIRVHERGSRDAAWGYPSPNQGYEAIRDHIAFYPGRVDSCFVNGERVQAQPGNFYGGWITSHIEGPFKGSPGTRLW